MGLSKARLPTRWLSPDPTVAPPGQSRLYLLVAERSEVIYAARSETQIPSKMGW